MSVNVTYKGNTLTSFNVDTKTLKTAGTYMEGDVTIEDLGSSIAIMREYREQNGSTGIAISSVGPAPIQVVDTTDPSTGLVTRDIVADLVVNLQTKTVIPSSVEMVVTPDSGYDGLSECIVTPPSAPYLIPTGTATISENGTHDIAAYESVTVNVVSEGVTLQEKSVTPDETAQTVTADSGYDGLSSVNISAIPSTYVGSGIAQKAAATYTPSTAAQTIAAGQYLSGAQTIAAIPSEYVVPSGTLSISSNGTQDVTNYASVSVNVASTINNQDKSVTPTESQQIVSADAGYTGLGNVTVGAIDSSYVGSNIAIRSAANIDWEEAEIYIPAGYYSDMATVSLAQIYDYTNIVSSVQINNSTGLITAIASTSDKGNVEDPTTNLRFIGQETTTSSLQLPTQAATTIIPSETAQTAVDSGKYTTGIVSVAAISADYVGSGVSRKTAADLTVSGNTVTAPAGYYAAAASKSVTAGSVAVPTTAITANPTLSINNSGLVTASVAAASTVAPTVTTGYVSTGTSGAINVSGSSTLQLTTQAATTIVPSETAQTAVNANTYTTGIVSVAAISSTYVGSGITTRSNTDLTASGSVVTAPAGYYASAATKAISGGTATTPATTINVTPSISVNTSGQISVSVSESSSVTPTVSAGYISAGTAGTISITGTSSQALTTQAATTITPSETQQTAVASQRYTTGNVVVAAISADYVGSGVTRRTSTDLTASGSTVTAPAGYYSTAATKTVSAGTAGTPTAAKGTVSNHQISITPSVTNTTGWITGSTLTGTAATVSASELVSGTSTISANGTYDVTNYATASVSIPYITYYTGSAAPTSGFGSNGDIYLQTVS